MGPSAETSAQALAALQRPLASEKTSENGPPRRGRLHPSAGTAVGWFLFYRAMVCVFWCAACLPSHASSFSSGEKEPPGRRRHGARVLARLRAFKEAIPRERHRQMFCQGPLINDAAQNAIGLSRLQLFDPRRADSGCLIIQKSQLPFPNFSLSPKLT